MTNIQTIVGSAVWMLVSVLLVFTALQPVELNAVGADVQISA